MIEPHATRCAICGSINNDRELFPAPFDESAFNPATLSARRLPGRIHYRMVKYDSLGLIPSSHGVQLKVDLPMKYHRPKPSAVRSLSICGVLGRTKIQ